MLVSSKATVSSEVLRLSSFERIREILLEKAEQITELLDIFVHEVADPMEELQDHRLRKELRFSLCEAQDDFIAEVNRLSVVKQRAAHCLVDPDSASKVSLLLDDIHLMMLEMVSLHVAIFQSP